MKADLETHLWLRIRMAGDVNGDSPRSIIAEMVEKRMIPKEKLAWRTLRKWADKGWYNYGVCLDLGWREIEVRPR